MKQLWVRVDPWDKELVTTALESGADAVWVPPDWTIIPLENLVAQSHNIFVEVKDEDAARTALGVLEKGVDGLVVTSAMPAVIKNIARLVKDASMPVTLP